MPRALTLVIFLLLVIHRTPAQAETVRIFLIGGASNTLGQGFPSDLEPPWSEPQEDVWIWQDDLGQNVGWTALRPGFALNDNNMGSGGNHDACNANEIARGHCGDRFGVELTLGRGLADAFPGDQIAIVKHAYGGRRVHDHWNPDTVGPPDRDHMYAGLKDKLQDATEALSDQGFDSVVAGMFWVNVAGDAKNSLALDHETNLTRLIAAVRNDLAGDLSMPFIIAGAHPFIGWEELVPFIDVVRQSERNIAAADPLVGFVDTDDVSLRPFNAQYPGDWYHFDSAGLLDLGERLATSYVATAVPEPGSLAMLAGLAMMGLLYWWRRRSGQ